MFERFIETYRTDLSNYCRMLTGTPWDADDLYQETLLKSYKYQDNLLNHPNPKAYLLKIASTTWIDMCKKNSIDVNPLEDRQLAVEHSLEDQLIIEDVVEDFAACLPPKQAVVVLLIDVFKFTAKETASMFDTTTGAVKSLLHRGRLNLAKRRILKKDEKAPKELIESFKRAIRLKNPQVISLVYKDIVSTGMAVKYSKEQNSFIFIDPEGNMLGIVER